MIQRHFGGQVPDPGNLRPEDRQQVTESEALVDRVRAAIDPFRLSDALDALWTRVNGLNQYIAQQTPWTLAKNPHPAARARRASVLYVLAESIRSIALHLAPFLPKTAETINHQLGDPLFPTYSEAARWGGLEPGIVLLPGSVLFSKYATPAADTNVSFDRVPQGHSPKPSTIRG